jgi:hypothetical protein
MDDEEFERWLEETPLDDPALDQLRRELAESAPPQSDRRDGR